MEKPQTSAPWGLSSALALAVVVAISPGGPTFAGCTWTWDGDHDPPGWHVHCSFQDDIFIEGTEGPGGSGGGSCTNCVGMTSEQCNAIKTNIIGRAETIFDECNSAYGDIGDAKYNLDQVLALAEQIKAEGDTFQYYPGTNTDSLPGSNNQERVNNLLSGPTGQYLFETPTLVLGRQDNILQGGNNAIYNYYNDRILPFVDDVVSYVNTSRDYLADAEIKIDEVQTDVLEIRNAASSMNCNACAGSGSGGSSGTPGDGGCPCAAYIRAVEAAVVANGVTLSSILASVNLSKDTLAQILSKLTEIKTVLDNIKDDVYRIRQTTDLMDDFFKEDTEINFGKLIEHTLTLSNVVVNFPSIPQYKLHSDYSNATDFATADGTQINWWQKGNQILTPSDGKSIDFGEYSTLNWFQRIEFLLGSIAGIFSPTNDLPSSDFSRQDKNDIDSATLGLGRISYDDQKSRLLSLSDSLAALRSKFTLFQGLVGSPSKPQSITVVPDISLSDWKGRFGAVNLSSTVDEISIPLSAPNGLDMSLGKLVDFSHDLSTFLWLFMILVVDVLAFVWFVRRLVSLNRWYWGIVKAWSPSLIKYGR